MVVLSLLEDLVSVRLEQRSIRLLKRDQPGIEDLQLPGARTARPLCNHAVLPRFDLIGRAECPGELIELPCQLPVKMLAFEPRR